MPKKQPRHPRIKVFTYLGSPMVEFTVFGKAQPGGSKSAIPYRTKNRKSGMGVRVTDSNPHAQEWKNRCAMVAAEAWDKDSAGLLSGPLAVFFDFTRARPKGHYGTGRNAGKLKDSAPAYPTVMPDGLKLTRPVEDALTGVLWTDDAIVVAHLISKKYGPRPGVTIKVWSMQ